MPTAKTLELQPLSDEALDLLAEQIELRKCVLVLGPALPAALLNKQSIPVRQLVLQALNADLQQQAPHLLPADPADLAMTSTAYQKYLGGGRLLLDRRVGQLLRSAAEPSELLRQVAHLPTRIILTVGQDLLLERAFEKEGRLYQQGAYRIGKTQDDEFDEKSQRPFIYHLFGKVLEKDVDSLVLTQQDQMDYIDSVQGVGRETRLPPALRNAMQDCPCFLFLGFNYENWYLRVLLHILQFSNKAEIVFGMHNRDFGPLAAATGAFFQNQFKFSFAAESDTELVQRLLQKLGGQRSTPSGTPTGVPARKLLFLSAPKDREFTRELDRALALVKRRTNTTAQFSDDIPAGAHLVSAPRAMLDEADLIIPILSVDFCNDELLVADLLPRALARHTDRKARLVAVYAREVSGAAELLQGKAAILPGEDIPVSDMNRDRAFEKIARELEKILEAL